MKFSIVTPSFNSARWLPLCLASVADQKGVEVEHLVQDAGSCDGTLDWLPSDPRAQTRVEPDRGMYDAIARGFARASGEVLAYLNCDEQYLPGTLAAVQRYFLANPKVEAVIAHWVVTDAQGDYLCHRYALRPLWTHLWYRFNVSTSALFMRNSVVKERGLTFDAQWRYLGDFFWLEAAVRVGVRFGVLDQFTSVFTETGSNLSLEGNILREEEARRERTPMWIKATAPLWRRAHQWRYWHSGAFQQRAFAYELFTQASPDLRVRKEAAQPTALWSNRNALRDLV